jgi:hypothetical protein
MPRCDNCGTETPYPFECHYCSGIFCAEHRLPEAHRCPSLSGTQDEQGKAVEGDRVHFTIIGRPEEAVRRRESRKAIIALCMMLVILPIIAVGTYNLGYGNGNTASNSYNLGYGNGYTAGHRQGYATGFADGNISGYNFGYQAGMASRGFNIVDPTYQQMLSFMATDTVHNNAYSSVYVCWNFCNDYVNEAFSVGWRCGFVYISFPDSAHGVVCFNTTDRGIIFVEPQFNSIVKVAIGLSYWSGNGFTLVTYNDTIVNLGVIW